MGENGERRGGAAGQRVHFEALVAVGGAANGAGFEAESVDVSPEGMRLRAAYLPEMGDRLLCRFDGPGGEVVAEGEVCWRNDEARGGEFGLRFVGLDAAAEDAVRAMCAALGGPAEPAAGRDAGKPGEAGDGPAVNRGSRVRLHIEGLGSPMKARVRGGGADNVEVGSNLEFLKVGRSLEIEDVEGGARREVYIEEVKVEIDPSTSIPQLVVMLRHEGAAPPAVRAPSVRPAAAPAARPAAPPPARAAAAPAGALVMPTTLTSRSGAVTRRAGVAAEAADGAGENDAAEEAELSPALDAREPELGQESSELVEARPSAGSLAGGLRAFGDKAAAAGASAAGKLGPALAGAGARMRGAMIGIVERIQQHRAERAGEAQGEGGGKRSAGPRRMTAPPAAGALRSEGRRLIRDDEVEEGEETPPPKPAVNKKAAAVGSFLGLAAVLVIFGVTRLAGLHGGGGATAQDPAAPPALPSDTAPGAQPGAQPGVSGAQLGVSGAQPGTPGAQPGTPGAQPGVSGAQLGTPGAQLGTPGAPSGVGGPIAANVPLFGATPLSTTEPVPPPAPPPDPATLGAANLAAGDPGAPAQGADAAEEPSFGEAGAGDSDGDSKSWGQGSVKNPVVLKLKMDGPIEELNGAAGSMGFTVSLRDRRALSSGSDLARKDKRIASLRVVNTPHGAEVTVQFKDGVPAYRAKANGNRLEIALGNDEAPKKVASKSKKSKKSKDDKGKKQKKDGKEKKHPH